ncbi:electron transfer flavoprotein subunit beta/FixA family protein [Aquabacterium sp. A08]|uniref:electron transfer flavoprotein subunit beta/FixA family protein n=1 Tax=Aquabacterium sp. A08 TaxID=2718532 RepID=UPI001422EF52|nr:electron transfer flavoprotein subunit beta/FixA family protein [Aquabacterium sp. A08]NIC41073.1 electron transfer flavoprotein subunit beta/FixA family protein [Aquabacterium sp. A08]NIC41090.1 electron transfer flavoprotein subunit beta/FixA family protein [Aquabacterium sp. A08]
MHVLVFVKRVVDYNVKVRVRSDGTGVDTAGLKMSLNPFDEVAVEQAVRWRQAGVASQVTVVACGQPVVQDVLRTALAMGADRALLLDPGSAAPDGPAVLAGLAALVQREGVDLLLCGKQAIDDDLGDTAPALAALLDWPQALSVNRVEWTDGGLRADCDGDLGLEQWRLPLPAVLGVDLRLCDPRPIGLPSMMKAKKAPIDTVALADLAADTPAHCSVAACTTPPARAAGQRLADLPQLLAQLRQLPALQPGA